MKKAFYKLKRSYWRLKFIKIPVKYEIISGRADPNLSNIISVKETDLPLTSKSWAIVLMWSPDNSIKKTFENLLKALKSSKVNILLVCNHRLSEAQQNIISDYAKIIIVRNNQGFDIGGYKDSFNHLIEQNYDIDRLGFFNDSVFYREKGLIECINNLYSSHCDVSALMENWELHHHFQSFGIVLNHKLLTDPAIIKFWKSYKPVSNRVYAIHKGEIQFSNVIRKQMTSSFVMYGAERLSGLIDEDLDEGSIVSSEFCSNWIPSRALSSISSTPKPLRELFYEIDTLDIDPKQRIKIKLSYYKDFIYNKNMSHIAAIPIIKYAECPFLKKDLVYREIYDYTQMIPAINLEFDEKELEEITQHYKTKGVGRHKKGVEKKKYLVGIS